MWDLEEVRKYAHMDSVASTTGDEDEGAPSSSKAKPKPKSKSRKHARNESGSDTENESGRDLQVIGVISTGIDGLVVSRKETSLILAQQLDLVRQKEAREREAQDAKIKLDTRSTQITEFIKLSELLAHVNPQVSSQAQALLGQLNLNLVALPFSSAPTLAAWNVSEQPQVDHAAPAAGSSVQPVASGSGATSADQVPPSA
jgi:hypothetical protein